MKTDSLTKVINKAIGKMTSHHRDRVETPPNVDVNRLWFYSSSPPHSLLQTVVVVVATKQDYTQLIDGHL